MTTLEKLHKVLNEEKQKHENDSILNSHLQYYEELRKNGFIKRQEYTIPPIDTVGKRLTKCNYCSCR